MRVDVELDRGSSADTGLRSGSTQTAILLSSASSSNVMEWIARLAIVLFACGMAWHTWGHWGDFQIDSGRELYVPAAILKGKLLFRDLWYMYGPLAPYLKALLFWIFGVHLNVLYAFGLSLAIGTALLTFEVGRGFGLGVLGSTVAPLFFLFEAFYPTLRNFIFPYSYAASLGAFLGAACLYFVMRHASSRRSFDLGAAALLGGLVVLTKQEMGVSCLALLGFEVAACYGDRRSGRELRGNIGTCLAGLFPAAAVYAWFIWKVSLRVLLFVNWISTPGTYFMRTFGKFTIPAQGLRFVPSELFPAVGLAVVGLALWAFVGNIIVSAIKELHLKSQWSIAAATFGSLLPLLAAAVFFEVNYPWGVRADPAWAMSYLVGPLTQAIFPDGLFFLVLFFTIHALWKLRKTPGNVLAIQEAGLGIYAAFVGVRMMMELRPTSPYQSTVCFNSASFLIFVVLLCRVISWACTPLDPKQKRLVTSGMLISEIGFLAILFFPNPRTLPIKLVTDYGSFYTRKDAAALLPQIISFMKSHTRNGKDILVLPEPPSLYVFAGMEAPSRWYSLVPGYVAPEQEQDFIDDVTRNQVRYILISNRIVIEYHVSGFANGGYNQGIYRWIMANYVRTAQFGPRGAQYPPYIVWVYERRDLAQQDRAQKDDHPQAALGTP